jgi:dTDP-4-dehydrorhamnose reductase
MVENGPRILITGASGLVGYSLARSLGDLGDVHATVHKNPVDLPDVTEHPLNLLVPASVDTVVAAAEPDILIHSAAVTDVEECERNWHLAYTVNVRSTMRFAELMRKRQRPVILISTDLVYGGERGHYRETDIASPLSSYGWTKLIAESHVARASESNTILRAALIYGKGPGDRHGFVGWMRRALEAGEKITLYQDEYRTPLYLGNLVSVVREVIQNQTGGLYHIAGTERINRYDLGMRFANVFGLPADRIEPGSVEDHKGVPRARDCSLNTDRASAVFETEFLTVREGLRELREEWGEED